MQSKPITNSDRQAVEFKLRDLLVCALAIGSGAVDAISFLALGKVFSAFMTGNIVFLGLRVAGVRSPGAVSILVSMTNFALGVYIATRIIARSERPCVWPQRVTVALGVSLIAHAVFVVVWFASNGQPSTDVAHVLLGSAAFAMGMQSDAVRSFGLEGVFTTAATGTLIHFVRAVTNWSALAAERRRHAGLLVSLFLGGAGGGLLLLHARILAPVLPFVITAGTVVTAAMAFREDPADEDERP